MINVFIDGSAGTTGLRIRERLQGNSEINLLLLPEELRKDPGAIKAMMNKSDVTFLCLPDAASMEAVTYCENPQTVILDTSTAHRTNPDWAYGFAELSTFHRDKIKKSKRIAVPGCHASGFCSVVYPLVASGIISPEYPVTAHSLTGYSGGGKNMIKDYTEAKTAYMESPAQYGLGQTHKHLPEMKTVCGLSDYPVFSPIVADYYSGMAVTVPIFTKYMEKKVSAKELCEFYSEYYKDAKLIKVLPYNDKGVEGGFLYSNTLSGKDNMEIIVSGNDDRIVVVSRFCNLGKGASGAAIQCMNISCGLEETEGLELV